MAPASNPAKSLQQTRPRPIVPRAIIPAIPLPYVQKRKQHEAARAKAREEAAAAFFVEPPTSPEPNAEENTKIVNGLEKQESDAKEETVEPAVASTPATPAAPVALPVEEVEIAEENNTVVPAELSSHEDSEDSLHKTPISASAASETQSNASRSTYHMPPAFVPAHQNQVEGNGVESVNFPPHLFNGQQNPMHHAHPSAGSVMFGGYPESDNSSPVHPPPSAGFMPPHFPVQHMHNGSSHHGPPQSNGHSHHLSSGYSSMGPPPPPGFFPSQNGFMNHHGPPAENNYARRQMVSFGPPEGFTPSGSPLPYDGARHNNFEQHAPSFHGSQSSATNEQENGPAFYSQYPSAVISNGSNGHVDEARLYQQSRPKPRTGSQPQGVPSRFADMGPPMPDHMDGLMHYIQSQFADPEFADYVLELRYTDDRAPPVRIPGHNLMFARSPKLKVLMEAKARDNSSDGGIRTLLMETTDRFLRSDGFWMAVQRLYGCPLLEFGPINNLSMQHSAFSGSTPGTPQDRFDLALGYAAAGTLLQIPPVVARGCEIAAHLVNWVTVEKAMDFALDGGFDNQWTLDAQQDQTRCPATYGPAVNMLVHNGLNFIITAFPAGLELDTSAPEPTRNRRLPFVPESRGPGHNPRLSFIKFGDHPSQESVRSSNPNPIPSILSKILLNLPFHLLKYVLESSRLGNVQGWATTALRTKVMHQVIEERETRRIKVLSSYVPNAERQANAKDWDNVGWKETVVPFDGNDATPTLQRTWVGFSQNES